MFRSENYYILEGSGNLSVLILVVVDVPFGANVEIQYISEKDVLILVVVDVPFGECVFPSQKRWHLSLNPCCSGCSVRRLFRIFVNNSTRQS